MNIFYFDPNIKTNVESYCDKHIVKMILESTQILSTIRKLNNKTFYLKPTHVNHPSTQWVNQSINHYKYLIKLTEMLMQEYQYRYNKEHTYKSIIEEYKDDLPDLPNIPFMPPTKAMPEYYKYTFVSTSNAYRHYFFYEKSHIHQWKQRPIPTYINTMYEQLKPLNNTLYVTTNDFHYSEENVIKLVNLLTELEKSLNTHSEIIIHNQYVKYLKLFNFDIDKSFYNIYYDDIIPKSHLKLFKKANLTTILGDKIERQLTCQNNGVFNSKLHIIGFDKLTKKVYNLVNQIINI